MLDKYSLIFCPKNLKILGCKPISIPFSYLWISFLVPENIFIVSLREILLLIVYRLLVSVSANKAKNISGVLSVSADKKFEFIGHYRPIWKKLIGRPLHSRRTSYHHSCLETFTCGGLKEGGDRALKNTTFLKFPSVLNHLWEIWSL